MARPYLGCPQDWLRSTLAPDPLGGVIERVDTGSTPATGNDAYWDGGIAWLTPKDITGIENGLFVTRTERTLSPAGLNSCSARVLPAGTVLLTKRAPVGTVAINAVPMATNQGFLNFTCGPLLRPVYLAYWLRANTPYLDLVANGSTYPELYAGDLFEFELAIPSLDTQDRTIDVLSSLQLLMGLGAPLEQSVTSPTALLALQDQDRRLGVLRDRLLPLLLSGQIDLSRMNARAPSQA
jgi:hypothetical protein